MSVFTPINRSAFVLILIERGQNTGLSFFVELLDRLHLHQLLVPYALRTEDRSASDRLFEALLLQPKPPRKHVANQHQSDTFLCSNASV